MKKYVPVIIIVVLLVGIGGAIAFTEKSPGKYDTLAQCINDSGAKFYGAFWCPHCKATKALFGKSARLLPYIECSKPDGQSVTQICIDTNIKSYPTWVFPDNSRASGELPLQEIATRTNCPLPQ